VENVVSILADVDLIRAPTTLCFWKCIKDKYSELKTLADVAEIVLTIAFDTCDIENFFGRAKRI
jgi:hypothetical protein